jgi:DNA adenine methylase
MSIDEDNGRIEARPFLRWPGAKRSHVRSIAEFAPRAYGRYYEPFLGGGAVYFHLAPERAVLGDRITPLIAAYRAVRDGPRAVARYAAQWPVDRETFYKVRSYKPTNRFERAAQLIFLNKTCWNGLYRVNSSGQFNVPYGRPKSARITNETTLCACSAALRRTTMLLVGDFEETLSGCRKGDLIYLDPPYVTGHANNGFIDYNESLFSWSDQLRLAHLVESMARRGVHIIVTNADHEKVRELYTGLSSTIIRRHSTLAGAAEFRRPVTEAIYTTARLGK